MLRACVLQGKGDWEKQLPLIEIAYNNGFQATIQMAPYETLYGRKCKFHLYWDEVRERKIYSAEILQEMKEQILLIKERMKATQHRQKSYAERKRMSIEFVVGD